MPYMRVKNELPLIPGYSEGSIAYANDAAVAPLNDCKCNFMFTQSGSGNPSPSNVRPITGYSQLIIDQKDSTGSVLSQHTMSFGTVVYGGTVNIKTGVLTLTHKAIDLGQQNWSVLGSGNGQIFRISLPDSKVYGVSDISDAVCEMYYPISWTVMANVPDIDYIFSMAYADKYLAIKNHDYSTKEDFNTAMSGVKLVYELATPITSQLTPLQISTLLGDQNFSHDANGDIQITFIRRNDS